jgi:hypothetical protein
METKGAGQEKMEKCLGSGQGPNWAVEPLVSVLIPPVNMNWEQTVNRCVNTIGGSDGVRIAVIWGVTPYALAHLYRTEWLHFARDFNIFLWYLFTRFVIS